MKIIMKVGNKYATIWGKDAVVLSKSEGTRFCYHGKVEGCDDVVSWDEDGISEGNEQGLDELDLGFDFAQLDLDDDCYDHDATATQVGGDHYSSKSIQPIDYIHANKLGFCEGNVIKYVTRHKDKNGKQDIEKAIHYLQIILQQQYS